MLDLAAIIVAHAVAQIVAQHRRLPALGGEPGAEADPVEREQGRIARAVGDRQGEGRLAVAAGAGRIVLHRAFERLEIVAIVGGEAGTRDEPFLPAAVPEQPLLEVGAELVGVVDRRSIPVANDHAEPAQQMLDAARLAIGDREIMGAEREGGDRVAAAARIAADLVLELEQAEVAKARLGEGPAGGEAGDAAAGNDDRRFLARARRREVAVAQAMAARHVGAGDRARRRVRPEEMPAQPSGRRDAGGAEAREHCPPARSGLTLHSAPIVRRGAGPGDAKGRWSRSAKKSSPLMGEGWVGVNLRERTVWAENPPLPTMRDALWFVRGMSRCELPPAVRSRAGGTTAGSSCGPHPSRGGLAWASTRKVQERRSLLTTYPS